MRIFHVTYKYRPVEFDLPKFSVDQLWDEVKGDIKQVNEAIHYFIAFCNWYQPRPFIFWYIFETRQGFKDVVHKLLPYEKTINQQTSAHKDTSDTESNDKSVWVNDDGNKR